MTVSSVIRILKYRLQENVLITEEKERTKMRGAVDTRSLEFVTEATDMHNNSSN